jgi:Cu(I)/Ag(I) efflux system membrane protein CusA/SilA
MVARIIELCARRPWAVFAVIAALVGWAVWAIRTTPLDAIPDLTDPQVIVYTDWMGRSPDLVEDQITYPMVSALQSTPRVTTVRGFSMFGMSFIYLIFEEGTDIYWARTRVLEQLARAQQLLPPDAVPTLGPDASGIGWVYQYVIEDASGRLDLAELRELQDFTIAPVLQAVPGVAEVASLGGYERQYQIVLDPTTLASFGLGIGDIRRAVDEANSEIGAHVVEMAGRELVVRGRGYVRSLEDLEGSVVGLGPGGNPLRLRDVATVQYGSAIRRVVTDYNGRGEAAGAIVVMRMGFNALEVIEATKRAIGTLSLPPGVRIVPTYDRAPLIRGSVNTLARTLGVAAVIVSLVCLVFLFHLPSALVVVIVLPTALALTFIPLRYLGLTTNIMSLGGIAIAVGTITDAAVVLIENAHVRLAQAPAGASRTRVIIDAAKDVGAPIFFSLLLITVSFMPIFLLPGQSGRLFQPLAYTKTFAMLAAALLSITLAPPLMVLLLRGRIRSHEDNPVARALVSLYRPVVALVVRARVLVVAAGGLVLLLTVPVFMRLGSEFMPPLDEGSLLVMPTTFAGISSDQARQVLTAQDRILMSFGEVSSVHGKAGRAETATDPAQLDMIETVVLLHPRSQWPRRFSPRWYSADAPEWSKPVLRLLWPERRARSLSELSSDLSQALLTPGYQISVSPPIRTRIDMLTTGVRTPAGVKVFGTDLAEIERLSLALEELLGGIDGTRSVFAERQSGREYIDILVDREAIARQGLTVRGVHDVIETAVGGLPLQTVISGRSRFTVNARYGADFRADPQALRGLLVQVPPAEAPFESAGQRGAGSGQMGVATATSGQMGVATATSGQMGAGGMGAPGARNMGSSGDGADVALEFGRLGSTVTLGELADVRVVTGPPMIRNEDGVLVGYVYADIEGSRRDLGGWVAEAQELVAERLVLPDGYRLGWTGQYELLEQTEARLRSVVPLTLAIIVLLLYLAVRGIQQTLLVFMSLPFAAAGSIWLLSLLGYNLSAAVWVGIIAVAGLAAENAVVMMIYLDQAYRERRDRRDTGALSAEDIDAAVIDGASLRVRPLLMTASTDVLALMPLLVISGTGADVAARTAAPVVGGVVAAMLLTLFVLPAAYAIWRRHQLRHGSAVAA